MHGDSLILPLWPLRPPRPIRPGAGRWFRALSLSRSAPAGAGSPQRAARRLRKVARRGGRIVLGSAEQPYEPLVLGAAPLRVLRPFEGLEIAIATRSSQILEQLDLLVELDQRHSVAVDVLSASLDPASPGAAECLRTVSALSAQGLTTRLVLTDLPRLSASGNAVQGLRRLLEAARECRAFDVAAAFRRGAEAAQWRRILRHQRLELGFPRPLPGRG